MQLSNSVGATLTPSSRSTSSSKNSLTNLGVLDFVPNAGNSPPLSSKSANRSQNHSGNTTCSSSETYQSHSSRTASNQTTFSSNSRNYQNSQNSSHTSNNSSKKDRPSTHLNQYEAVQCNPAPMDAPKEASRVLPFLWQGSLENATDPVFSKDAKITHIVNVSTFTYDLPSTVHPQNYLQIAVLDAFGAHLAPYLDKCVRFLKSANRLYEDTNGETGSCLVHCQAGISRSSIVSIAFLMNHRHMGWEPAKDYLKQRRYFINPNMNFAGELVTYEKLLIERGVISKNGTDVVSISGFSLSHSRKSSTVSNLEEKSRPKTVDHNGYIKQQNEKLTKPTNSKKPSRPKFLKLLCVNSEKNDPTDNMVEKIAKSEKTKKLRNHELGKIKSDTESVSSNAPTSAPRSKPNRPSGLSINCLGKVRRPKPSSLNIKRNQNSSYNNFQQITDEVLSSTPVNDKDSVGKNSLGKNSLGRNSDKISVSGESSKESSGGLCGMKAGAKVAMKNVRKSLKLPIVRHQDSSNSEKFPSPNECDVHSGRLHSTSKTVESSGSSKSSKRNSNFGLNLSRLKPTRTSPKPSSPKPASSPKVVEGQKGFQTDKSSQNSHKNQSSWLPVILQKPSDSPVLMENSKVRNSQVRNSKTSQVRASPKFESKNTKISSEKVAGASQSVSRSSSFHCKNQSPISMSEHSSSAATFVNNCCEELESPNKFATTNPFRDLVSSNTAESSLHDSGNQSIQNQGCAKIDTISTQSCAISDTRVKSNTPNDVYSKSLPRPKKSEIKNAHTSQTIQNSKNTQNCQNNQYHNQNHNQNQSNQHQINKNHQQLAQNTCPQPAANQVPATSHNFDQANNSGNSFLEKQLSVTSANSSGIVSGTNSGNTTTLQSHSMSTDEQHTSVMSDMNSSHVCTSPTSSSTLSSPSSNIKNSSNNSSISFIRKAYDPVRHFTSELKNTATNTLLKLKTSRDYDEAERAEEGLAIMGGGHQGLDGSFDASSAGRYHQIGYDSEEAKSPELPFRGTPLDQKLKKITIKPPATSCENERQELAEIFAKTSTAKIVNPQQLPTPPPRLHEQQRIKSSEQYNPTT